MGNSSKLRLFTYKESYQPAILKIGDELIHVNLNCVDSAPRPEGFRYSKFICAVSAEARGIISKGGGESYISAKNAFDKAKSEAVERLCLKIYSTKTNQILTSSGWSAHLSEGRAKTNAALELLERDAVLVQWLRAASLNEIALMTLPLKLQWWRLTELRKSEFPILRIFLTTVGFYPVVVAVLQSDGGFGVTGAGTSTNLKNAVDSALTEACRAAHHHIRKSYDVDDISNHLPGVHSVMYSVKNPFPKWFLKPGAIIKWHQAEKLFSKDALDLAISKSEINFKTIATGDRTVVRAYSKNLQSVFWGPSTQKDVLNLERIKSENVNLLPHIVG